MPRLNNLGRSTTGYGVCWYDDARTIFQKEINGVWKIVLSDGAVIANSGANHLFAKNRVWIAQLIGFGVYGSRSIFLPEAGLSDAHSDLVSPDGAIAIKDLYHSFGPWHVHEINGTIWLLTDGAADSIQLLGNKKAIWLISGRLFKTDNLELDIPSRLMWWPRVALVNSKYKLLYQDQKTKQLVLDNRILEPPSDTYFRPDFMQLPNGMIKVVWSPNEGEDPIINRILSISELNSLPVITDIPIPIPPTPTPTPEPEPVMEGITDKQFETLKKERAKYGNIISSLEIGAILNATAWAHKDELGLQKKPGSETKQPKTNIPIWNGLWIKRGGKDFGQDVLGSASVGIATPVRGEVFIGQPDRFTFVPPVEPVDITPVPVPEPKPTPTPTTDPKIAELIASVDKIKNKQDEHQNRISSLEEQIEILKNKSTTATRQIRIAPAGAGDPARVTISTSSRFAHSHEIGIKVVEE